MKTYEDDHRIMTDVDMANAEDLSDTAWEHGATSREVRLMACMRLLLAHVECRTEEVSNAFIGDWKDITLAIEKQIEACCGTRDENCELCGVRESCAGKARELGEK